MRFKEEPKRTGKTASVVVSMAQAPKGFHEIDSKSGGEGERRV